MCADSPSSAFPFSYVYILDYRKKATALYHWRLERANEGRDEGEKAPMVTTIRITYLEGRRGSATSHIFAGAVAAVVLLACSLAFFCFPFLAHGSGASNDFSTEAPYSKQTAGFACMHTYYCND